MFSWKSLLLSFLPLWAVDLFPPPPPPQLPILNPFSEPRSSHPGVLHNLTGFIDALARKSKMPGLSLALVYADREEFSNWGVRSEEGDLSSEDTLYCIASNSKAFTATALGLLIDDFQSGRNVTPLPPGVQALTWGTKASDLLPGEWQLQDGWASEKASLRDMLGHVTGLPRHEFSYGQGERVDEVVRRMRYLAPTYEFREQYQYNNQMYMAASYILSKYSGQTHMSFVSERIFKPLGMHASTFYPSVAFDSGKLAENWLNSAGPDFNETRRIPYFLQDWSEEVIALNAGPGGVITSTGDLTQWVRTLLLKGKAPSSDEQVIPISVIDNVTTGYSVVDGKGMFPELSAKVYGAGWERWSYAGHEMVQHGGSVPGFSSVITLLPNDEMGIIALSNGQGHGPSLLALTGRIMEESFQLPVIDWQDRFPKLMEAEKQNLPQLERPTTPPPGDLTPVSHFAGTYENPGYFGSLTLCAWPSPSGSDCEQVLSDYAYVDPEFATKNPTTLYAHWKRVFLSHVKFEQVDSTTFDIRADDLYLGGCGKDTSPFFVRWNPEGGAIAEFGVDEEGKVTGFGGWGLSAGPKERVPGKPKESGEAWFDKVA